MSIWRPISEISGVTVPSPWDRDAVFWERDDTIVILYGTFGCTGMKPDLLESHDFEDAELARAIMTTLVHAWTNEVLYDTWENLMWEFFPDNMGN